MSVMVPLVVPLTSTLAPITDIPVLSVTLPFTVMLCAKAFTVSNIPTVHSNKNLPKLNRGLFFMLLN